MSTTLRADSGSSAENLFISLFEDVFGAGLKDYWGMESWSETDRTGLIDKFVGGWNDRLNKNGTVTE